MKNDQQDGNNQQKRHIDSQIKLLVKYIHGSPILSQEIPSSSQVQCPPQNIDCFLTANAQIDMERDKIQVFNWDVDQSFHVKLSKQGRQVQDSSNLGQISLLVLRRDRSKKSITDVDMDDELNLDNNPSSQSSTSTNQNLSDFVCIAESEIIDVSKILGSNEEPETNPNVENQSAKGQAYVYEPNASRAKPMSELDPIGYIGYSLIMYRSDHEPRNDSEIPKRENSSQNNEEIKFEFQGFDEIDNGQDIYEQESSQRSEQQKAFLKEILLKSDSKTSDKFRNSQKQIRTGTFNKMQFAQNPTQSVNRFQSNESEIQNIEEYQNQANLEDINLVINPTNMDSNPSNSIILSKYSDDRMFSSKTDYGLKDILHDYETIHRILASLIPELPQMDINQIHSFEQFSRAVHQQVQHMLTPAALDLFEEFKYSQENRLKIQDLQKQIVDVSEHMEQYKEMFQQIENQRIGQHLMINQVNVPDRSEDVTGPSQSDPQIVDSVIADPQLNTRRSQDSLTQKNADFETVRQLEQDNQGELSLKQLTLQNLKLERELKASKEQLQSYQQQLQINLMQKNELKVQLLSCQQKLIRHEKSVMTGRLHTQGAGVNYNQEFFQGNNGQMMD